MITADKDMLERGQRRAAAAARHLHNCSALNPDSLFVQVNVSYNIPNTPLGPPPFPVYQLLCTAPTLQPVLFPTTWQARKTATLGSLSS